MCTPCVCRRNGGSCWHLPGMHGKGCGNPMGADLCLLQGCLPLSIPARQASVCSFLPWGPQEGISLRAVGVLAGSRVWTALPTGLCSPEGCCHVCSGLCVLQGPYTRSPHVCTAACSEESPTPGGHLSSSWASPLLLSRRISHSHVNLFPLFPVG